VGGQPNLTAHHICHGEFAFHFNVDGKVIERQNRADYPATKDCPAFPHEDLTVIYSEPGGADTRRAIFFDNEADVIAYTAGFSLERKTSTFLGGVVVSAPRYGLTYTKERTDPPSIKFEIAPPGKPNAIPT
jgi:hypothetical protein